MARTVDGTRTPTGGVASVVAFVAAVLGVAAGNVTLTWFVACALGAVAISGGVVAIRRARRTGGPRPGLAIAAVVLGVVAIGLGIAGAVLLEDFFSSSQPGDAFVLTPD